MTTLLPDNTGISILIRTFNSGGTLRDVLSHLTLRGNDEILVVDSGSTDQTLKIASEFNARIIETKLPFNYSRALNDGFAAVMNPWVLVISSHCIPIHKNLLKRFRESTELIDETIGVIYGITRIDKNPGFSEEIKVGGINDWISGKFSNGGNSLALYRKSFWEMHNFDEKLVTAEDMEWFIWFIEKGYKAAVVCDAICHYKNNGSIRHMFMKGWNERQVSCVIFYKYYSKRKLSLKLISYRTNVLHLFKLLITMRISFHAFIRQIAHSSGAFLSSIIGKCKF